MKLTADTWILCLGCVLCTFCSVLLNSAAILCFVCSPPPSPENLLCCGEAAAFGRCLFHLPQCVGVLLFVVAVIYEAAAQCAARERCVSSVPDSAVQSSCPTRAHCLAASQPPVHLLKKKKIATRNSAFCDTWHSGRCYTLLYYRCVCVCIFCRLPSHLYT